MAARKLQLEIDKTLKKVAEGVEIFEDMYDLLQRSTNSTQKEKMESDLKTQIKKLQRLRDQIKTWLQSNDIKDKKPLLDNRKLIETQMEKFKACEKEMKTKAFSKEGLIAAAKMNPKDREKAEITDWLSTQVDELSRQVEAAEAEIETISGSGKKKKGSAKDERASELENANDRRNWHISRLEILLRMLENGNLDTDRVTDIKEDISYFVESNMEEDFEEDEGIYDDLNLVDGEEAFGLKENDDTISNVDSAANMDDLSFHDVKDTPIKQRRESVAESLPGSNNHAKKEEPAASPSPSAPAQPVALPSAPPSATKKTARKPSAEPVAAPKEKAAPAVPAVPTANFSQAKATPASAAAVLSPPKAPSAAPLPPIRYAAAAAAAVAASSTADTPAASPSTTTASIANDATSDAAAAPAASAPTSQPQPTAATQPTVAPATPVKSSVEAIKSSDATDKARSASPAPPGLTKVDSQSAAPGAGVSATASAAAQDASSTATSGFQPAQLAASSAAASVVQPAGGGAGTAAQQAAAQKEAGTEARLPTSLTDLVSSFESAKQKSLRRDANLGLVHKSLESSFMNVPEPLDSDKPKYYVPKNPFLTPSYYPQSPASVFDNPALYAKFDVDTLFYIFYYQQGTYHQYLAAKELKKQSWRFHKQYLTWFQRHSEPQAITDEYEQGVYVYFDWEGSWCQRKKSDFRFEYRWLEDN